MRDYREHGGYGRVSTYRADGSGYLICEGSDASGYLVRRVYVDYSRREAVEDFRAYLRAEDNRGAWKASA